MKPLRHIPALDGLRGCAALVVMVFHWCQAFPSSLGHAEPLRKLGLGGYVGVDLFFVLSGFLITRILLKTRNDPGYFRNFYARRALRIFPLYYVFLIFFYTLWTHWTPPDEPSGASWYFTYLQNVQITFSPQNLHGPGHFWSLAIEEHFYLIWPLLIYLVPVRRVPWLIGATMLVSLASRILLLGLGYEVFHFTPCRLDDLAVGGLLAWLELGSDGLARWRRPAWIALVALLPLAGGLWAASGSGWPVVQWFKFDLLAVLFGAFVCLVTAAEPGRLAERAFATGWLRWVGRVSYGTYVFHPVCFATVTRHFHVGNPALNLLAAFMLTFAAATLSYYMLERPFLSLKSRFGSRTTASDEVESDASTLAKD